MTATTDRCPGCHGSGIEMSGVTYAGMSEYVGCHECSPECPDDCGCRVSDDLTLIANEPVESCERCGAVLPPPYDRPEWAKSVAARHPGATQSPDGSPSATQGLRGPERAVTDAELVAYEAAAAAAYEAGLLGGMSREERAARHAALARGAESVPSAAQIGAESITVDVRRWASHMADRLDQAEAENARLREDLSRLASEWERELTSARRPPARDAVADAEAAEWAALADAATEGPWAIMGGGEYVSGIGTLVGVECAGGVRDVDAAFVAAARTAVPRLLADRERLTGEASRVPVLLADKAALMGDVDRLTAERDGARGTAATLEAENARLTEALYLTRITLEATFRVLQEASGLPDDIDDPDCRDEMVLALRPRAEKAEAEVARLREGIEALATEMQSDSCPACHAVQEDDWTCDHAEGMQHAGDLLRALLAEGGE